MNSHDREENDAMKEPIAKKSRALFEQASAHLDPATGNRLRLLRRDALASPHRRRPPHWLPLSAAAATLLAVGVIWWSLPRRTVPTALPNPVAASDFDQLPDEDTEMYAWLGDAPVATDDRGAGSQ